MNARDSIFLTHAQAVAAICRDFRQHEPQILLFNGLAGLLSHQGILARTERDKSGMWLRMPGERRMDWHEGADLVEAMCRIMSQVPLDDELLAAACSRVFQAKAHPASDPATGRRGIRIPTEMKDFVCRQCGRCCRTLDYHSEISPSDVAMWRRLKREDILAWVGVFKADESEPVYRIWMQPGTRQFADTCPFLQKAPERNRWICRIHDVKPQICREYPISRKHALMTGCPGFSPATGR